MSHSQRTKQLYYVAKHGKKDAVKGYSVIESIRQEESRPETGGRVPFTEEDTEIISNYFSDHISSRKAPTAAECKQFLNEHPLNRNHKQIRDKVRNIIGR